MACLPANQPEPEQTAIVGKSPWSMWAQDLFAVRLSP